MNLNSCKLVGIVLFGCLPQAQFGQAQVFSNQTAISIPKGLPVEGAASPYPSVITVQGGSALVTSVQVTLVGLDHPYPQDLDILLVSPDSTRAVMLMAHAGIGAPATSLRLTFKDDAPGPVPNFGALASQDYSPGDYSSGLVLPLPAPAAPYANNLSAFAGLSPNGDWKLYVLDDQFPVGGTIDGGWELIIGTEPPPTITLDATTPLPLHITENGTNSVRFIIADSLAALTNLQVVASSDNPVVLPPNGVTFDGPDPAGNMTAWIVPGLLQSGSNNLTLTVSRSGNASSSVTLPVVVDAINVPSTLSALLPISMPENTTNTIEFLVSDPDTLLSDLILEVSSTNEALIPSTSCLLFGLTNRMIGLPSNDSPRSSLVSLSLVPDAFQTGESDILLRLTDPRPEGTNVIVGQLHVSVTPVVSPPVISRFEAQLACPGASLGPVPFQVSSPFLPASVLTISAKSSDQSLVMDSNIVISTDPGTGGTNRNLTLKTEPAAFGGTTTITVTVSDGVNSASMSFPLSLNCDNFRPIINPSPISIIDAAVAAPYPSTIELSNLNGKISNLSVTVLGFTHSFVSDVGLLLVGPSGQQVVLMNNVASSRPGPTNINLTFNQTATGTVPANVPLTGGTYIPTDNSEGRTFLSPAPVGPYTNTLDVFNGTSPSGTWSLYVQDFVSGDDGVISGGWGLAITTTGPTLTQIPSQVILENTPGSVSFTVASVITASSNLVVTARSLNESVPGLIAGLSLSGTDAERSLLITPATDLPSAITNVDATCTIELAVTDGIVTNSTSFQLTVNYVNQAPKISGLRDASTPANVPVQARFTVTDVDSPLSNIVLTASSSIPALGFAGLSRAGSNYVITYTPTGVQGTNTVTVIASDGNSTTTNNFLAISTPGVLPVISPIAPVTTFGSRLSKSVRVNFNVDPGPIGSDNLQIVATRDNTNLVPEVTIALSDSGTNFTASVFVEPMRLGTARITLLARDEYGPGSNVFKLTVREAALPILNAIDPVTTPVNESPTVTLDIVSPDTPVADLLLSASNTNGPLLQGVTFNAEHTLATLNLAPDQVGFDLVTLKVDDGFRSSTQTLLLTVTPAGAISLAPIGTQTTISAVGVNIELKINSPRASVTNLTLNGSSTNKALVSNISFTYNGSNMVAIISVFPNRSGLDYIGITASDGFTSATQHFILRVTGEPGPMPPRLTVDPNPGGLALILQGIPQGVYGVQTSIDLMHWATSGAVTNDDAGISRFLHPTNAPEPVLFFRAVSQ